MSGDILSVVSGGWGGDATDLESVEVREVAKRPTAHRTVPVTKNSLAQMSAVPRLRDPAPELPLSGVTLSPMSPGPACRSSPHPGAEHSSPGDYGPPQSEHHPFSAAGSPGGAGWGAPPLPTAPRLLRLG